MHFPLVLAHHFLPGNVSCRLVQGTCDRSVILAVSFGLVYEMDLEIVSRSFPLS